MLVVRVVYYLPAASRTDYMHGPFVRTRANASRSPMAEAVLIAEAAKRPGLKLKVDSAGTGAYHVGDTADDR